MKLPALARGDGIAARSLTRFGGLNHTPGAGDGELWDMKNLTSDAYPLLASRPPRQIVRTIRQPGGLFSWGRPAWVEGDGFFYDGERKGTLLSPGSKTFAALGAYILIFPDKFCYNVQTGVFCSLEAEWTGTSLTFIHHTLYGEAAECNAVQNKGVNWADFFRIGDAVTISGCTVCPENNKTPIIREIDGDTLVFSEYAFTMEEAPVQESGTLTIRRTVPDLQYLCENENRLWGCDKDTIYACKPGDPFNWNVFEGLSTDSYAVDTGSEGRFTGCVSFLGYPTFFKEDHIYKVYGSIPSNFQVMGTAALGVKEGCAGTLAAAGGTLYYLSSAGVMGYPGSMPQCIGAALGNIRLVQGTAGSDGLKYYLSARDSGGVTRLYVFDSRRGLWHIEDDTAATYFARWDGQLYILTSQGEVLAVNPAPEEGTLNPFSRKRTVSPVSEEGAVWESPVAWMAEFGDFTSGSPYKKGVSKIAVRLELEAGASVQVSIQFDSDGIWQPVSSALGEDVKRTFYLPIIPRRADHYRLKLEGTGGCRIYAITWEQYSGSLLKSKPGRQ